MATAAAIRNAARWPSLALAGLITAYQRYLSPYKGFRCAHRVRHGGASCSAYAKALLMRRGVVPAFRAMRLRFAACAAAAVFLHASTAVGRDHDRRQREFAEVRAVAEVAGNCCGNYPVAACDRVVVGELASCGDAAACLSF